ncbi:MAG TPA: hypothetical protein VIK84_02265 [Haloplasmataceae bacterium]
MKSNSISFLFKGLILVVIDIIACLIIFMVWDLDATSIKLWAVLFTLVSLFMVNIVGLFSNAIISKFGSSMIITSSLYFLGQLIFTWLAYLQIDETIYIVISLIIFLAYLVTSYAFSLSGLKHKEYLQKKETQEKFHK